MAASAQHITAHQLAHCLGISSRTIYRWCARKILHSRRHPISGHRLISIGYATDFARQHGFPLQQLREWAECRSACTIW